MRRLFNFCTMFSCVCFSALQQVHKKHEQLHFSSQPCGSYSANGSCTAFCSLCTLAGPKLVQQVSRTTLQA